MLHFSNDYGKGAHPEILRALERANGNAYGGYGLDVWSRSATEKIRAACRCPDAEVYYLVGGTQTNATVIASLLRPYEGVVAAETGHINVHEAGAVEYTGHKVLSLPQRRGKLDPAELRAYLEGFYADGNHAHMVYPGMVYLSHPTEYGTLYTAGELEEIHSLCRQYGIPLFIDGARLGYGLMSRETDVTLDGLARHCDVFYIGGTKVGALFGEAVVFPRGNAPRQFYTMTKQHGAMLAKGWLTGLQFDTLFTDGLYFRISRTAVDAAERLKEMFRRHGLREYLFSPTNQQFVVLEDAFLQKLREQVTVDDWEKPDAGHTVVRFASSWYTTVRELDELDALLGQLLQTNGSAAE